MARQRTTTPRPGALTALPAALDTMLSKYGEAQFECGEWDRNESDESYDALHDRAVAAEERVRRVVAGLYSALESIIRQHDEAARCEPYQRGALYERGMPRPKNDGRRYVFCIGPDGQGYYPCWCNGPRLVLKVATGPKRCPECNGAGRGPNPRDILGTETCPRCGGTGR